MVYLVEAPVSFSVEAGSWFSKKTRIVRVHKDKVLVLNS